MHRSKDSEGQPAHTARIAWLVSFVVPIVVLAILGASRSASGFDSTPPADQSGAAPATRLDEEGEWEEFCAEADGVEAGGEECEVEEAEEEDEGEDAPPAAACHLRTARAHAVAFPPLDRVRLTLGYTTYEPARATVEFGSGGDRLGTASRVLGRSGVVRLTRHLGTGAMRRLSGSRSLTVTVRVAGAPARCRRDATERLLIDRSGAERITWSAGL